MDEFSQNDQKTKKLLSMHNVLHPRDDIDYTNQEEKEDVLPALERKSKEEKTVLGTY